MARFGDAERVRIADNSREAAQASAERVTRLIGRPVADPVELDVTDHAALVEFLRPVDSFLSAVPYWNNPAYVAWCRPGWPSPALRTLPSYRSAASA